MLAHGSFFTAGGQNKTTFVYILKPNIKSVRWWNVYPLIRSDTSHGLVDQSKHQKWPGVVFIGSLTNLMWPQHITSSSVSCCRTGSCIIVDANRDYLVSVNGCLGFDRTSNILK